MSSCEKAEAMAKVILANILEKAQYYIDGENFNEWLAIIKNFVKEVPLCLECGNILVRRAFTDSWNAENKPADVNEDLYCPNCGLRWAKTPPPHEFFKEAEPSG